MITLSYEMQTKFSQKLKIDIPDQLKKLIDQGFSNKKGAIIFSAFKELRHIKLVNPKDTFDMHKDLTGFECYANKIFLDEYIKNKSEISLSYLINLSLSFTDLFIKKWNSSIKEDCLLILNINEDLELGHSASFRFHKSREGEFWIDKSNIITSSELIMVCDTNSSIFES